MGSFSIWHWLIVLLIVVMVFGTKKLRNMGSDLGGAVKGFKDGMKDGSATPDIPVPPQSVTDGKADKSTIDVEARQKSWAETRDVIDLGISKMALIGAVALIVIGPEKLPRVARTVGTLLGKAQRYVNDVKAEVNRSMELDELRKMKDTVESAARDVEQSIHSGARDIENEFKDIESGASTGALEVPSTFPEYKHPRKNWRLKQGATPQWYKARNGVRTKALSGAARVARFRPHKIN